MKKIIFILLIALTVNSCDILKRDIDIGEITKSCEHDLSLFNSYATLDFKAIKVSSIGSTQIKFASVGTDYSQTQNYPNWVRWDIQTSTKIPQGFPLAGNFVVWIGEEVTANQKVKVEWIGLNNEVLCTQELSLPCQNQEVVIYKEKEFRERISKIVKFDGEFLVFKDRLAFKNVYNYLSDASLVWEEANIAQLDSIIDDPLLDEFENIFPEYKSLRKSISSLEKEMEGSLKENDQQLNKEKYNNIHEWFLDDDLNTLLNKNRAFRSGNEIWVFKTPTLLFQIPKTKNQRAAYENILNQESVIEMDNSVTLYDLEESLTIKDNFRTVFETQNHIKEIAAQTTIESKCDSIYIVSGYEPIEISSRASCGNAYFSYDRVACLTYNFYNNSSTSTSTFEWIITGNGSTSTYSSRDLYSHTFPAYGNYSVTLRFYCPENGERREHTLLVSVSQPVADFTYDQQECTLRFVFEFDNIGNISQREWNIYKQNTLLTTKYGPQVDYTFTEEGDYNVCYKVTDVFGCEDTNCKLINVSSKLNILDINYDFCCDKLDYDDVTINPEIGGGVCPLSYVWEFGDGSANSTSEMPTHRYICGQKYIATLTVKDAIGNEVTKQFTIQECQTEIEEHLKCPNGRITFKVKDGCVYSRLILSRGAVDPYTIFNNRPRKTWHAPDAHKTRLNNTRKKAIFWYTQSGAFNVWAYTRNKCSGDKKKGCNKCRTSIDISLDETNCCAKNDRDWKHYYFNHNNKSYRVRCVFSQLSMPMFFITRIKAKTKLKVKKRFLGVSYYAATKADEIRVKWGGDVFVPNGNWWEVNVSKTKCNCVYPLPKSGSINQTNKSKAKIRSGMYGDFTTKLNSITSEHYVKIGSTILDETQMQISLGTECAWNN